ncbi:MAG: DUF2304 domain-containing protein [Lachnospiraceae bacterium]
MILRLQLLIAVLIILAFVWIANLVRKEKLDLRFALPWFAVGILVFILNLFPQLMETMVDLLGIDLPVNMMFFFGFCFTLLLVFHLTMKVSRQEEQIKRLTQEHALLEEKLFHMKKDTGQTDGNHIE